MAFNSIWIDRYKAQGFYKHVEWERGYGVLVKCFERDNHGFLSTSFESGSFDKEYDQKVDNCRQFFLTREEAVKFMLNMGFNLMKIAKTFRQIDGKQISWEHQK